MKPKSNYQDYLFRCRWRATAITYRVPGKSQEDAQRRVENLLKRTEGGVFCESIDFLKVEPSV